MEPLLEREAELDLLQDRVKTALLGEGGVLVVEGSAGAGKSALVRALRDEAGSTGVQVRIAVGGELEREFPFGVVRQLLEPLVRAAEPEERGRLLEGAAALAAPVFGLDDGGADAGVDASFATLHGLYWLVAALTDAQPLLLVIDDAHWADEPSLRFCDFLARRAHELPLLVALAMRPGEAGAAHDLLASIGDVPDAAVLRPGALSIGATQRLVAEGLGEDVSEDVAASAHAATGGNPLLLRELVRTLASFDGVPTVGVVEAAVPSSVTRSVQRRLRRLPAAAQQTARALAVLGDRLPTAVLAAAGELNAVAVASSLAALREADLVEGDPPRFVHPLVRQAVADGVVGTDQAQLHRRAAEALRGVAGAEDQLVVHLLAGPPIGEAWAVELLRAAARRAQAEGAADVAVRRLRRALEELGAEPSPDILLELAYAEMATADPRGVERLQDVIDLGDDITVAGAITTQLNVGAIADPARMEVTARRALRLIDALQGDAHAARRDNLQSALLNMLTLDPVVLGDERLRMMAAIQREPTPSTLPMLSFQSATSDATRDETLALVRRAMAHEPGTGGSGLEGGLASWTTTAALAVDAPEEVSIVLERVDAARRLRGSRIVGGFADYIRAMWLSLYGSATLGEALARAAMEQFGELHNVVLERSVRAEVASLLVMLNRLDEADALMAGVADDDFDGLILVGCTWWTRRAEVNAARGRWADVVADLRRVEAHSAGWGWTRYILGFNEALLARALVAVAEVEEGAERAHAAVAVSARRGVPTQEAMACVALGHALGGDTGIDAFAAGVQAANRSSSRRIQATALLEHGSALRRAGHRKDARTALAAAREAANHVDAALLLARATDELAIAGGRPRRIAVSGVEALTPSERRVAEHAARGLTNREIAETLFVTRKTVEFTLGRVFSKLDITSRRQLPDQLGRP